MNKILKLQSHDGSNNILEQVEGHTYKLIAPYEYIRCGETSEGLSFIDPSGGPMIIEGKKLNYYGPTTWIVTKIEFVKHEGYLITLKNDLSSKQSDKNV